MNNTYLTVRAVRGGESSGKSASDGIVAQPGHIPSGNVKGYKRLGEGGYRSGCCGVAGPRVTGEQ